MKKLLIILGIVLSIDIYSYHYGDLLDHQWYELYYHSDDLRSVLIRLNGEGRWTVKTYWKERMQDFLTYGGFDFYGYSLDANPIVGFCRVSFFCDDLPEKLSLNSNFYGIEKAY